MKLDSLPVSVPNPEVFFVNQTCSLTSAVCSYWFGEVKGRRLQACRLQKISNAEIWGLKCGILSRLPCLQNKFNSYFTIFFHCWLTRCFCLCFPTLISPTDVTFQLRRGGNVREILICHNSETGGENTAASIEVFIFHASYCANAAHLLHAPSGSIPFFSPFF